jgi:hypothetical protein
LKIVEMLKGMDFGTVFEIHSSCGKVLKLSAYRGAELIAGGIRTLWWLLYKEEDGGFANFFVNAVEAWRFLEGEERSQAQL